MKHKTRAVWLVAFVLFTILIPTQTATASAIVEFMDTTVPRRTEEYAPGGRLRGTLTAGSYSFKNIEYNRSTGLFTMTASGNSHFWRDVSNNKRIRIRVYVYDSLGNQYSVSSSYSSSTRSYNVYHDIPSTISTTLPPQLNLTTIEVVTIGELYYTGDGYNDLIVANATRPLEVKPDPAVAAALAAKQEAELARVAAESAQAEVIAARTLTEIASQNVLLALQAANEARNDTAAIRSVVNQILAANVRLTWVGNKTATTSDHEYLNIENCAEGLSIRYRVGNGEYTDWEPFSQQVLIDLGPGTGLREITVQFGLDEEVYATKTTRIWRL